MQLSPVGGREVHVSQHIGFRLVHEGGKLRRLGAQLIGHLAPLRLGGLGILLCEGGGNEGCGDSAALTSGAGQQVAYQMHAAALPGSVQHLRVCTQLT